MNSQWGELAKVTPNPATVTPSRNGTGAVLLDSWVRGFQAEQSFLSTEIPASLSQAFLYHGIKKKIVVSVGNRLACGCSQGYKIFNTHSCLFFSFLPDTGEQAALGQFWRTLEIDTLETETSPPCSQSLLSTSY